jgi:thioesterase domain-containing protein
MEHPVLPKVFFFPPANGDLPKLAPFRSQLRGKISFNVIRYPGWREMARAGPNFEFLVDNAIAQIRSELGNAKSPCLFAGYSFWGFFTQPVATRLQKESYKSILSASLKPVTSKIGMHEENCESEFYVL